MSEGFRRAEYIPPEERNLHQFSGKNLKEVIEYLEGQEVKNQITDGIKKEQVEASSIFDGFLDLLRRKGVKVSTPEWLQFLTVLGKKTSANDLKELVRTNQLLNRVRIYAKTTLVKDKADESAFHEAFDDYFELAAKVYGLEIEDENIVPDVKEKLGIQEVDENLDVPEDGVHSDNEQVHGGKQDQHNDILQKADLSKQGGGDKKEDLNGQGKNGIPENGKGKEGEEGHGEGDKGEAGKGKGDKGEPSGDGGGEKGGPQTNEQVENETTPKSSRSEQQQLTKNGFLVGGGKGKSIYAERVEGTPIVNQGETLSKGAIAERKERVGKVDRRMRYEVRPDKASMREVIRSIRRIILDVSEVKGRSVDMKSTIGNFARQNFRFEYEKEREKQPEIVLFIDVGGPVDEWSPLVKEVAEAMSEGLTKLELYLFHNNLYGYVWKPDPKDLLASSYAKPDSLVDVKTIVKKRKKVIIYGDAEMSYSEFEGDGWPPSNNEERIKKFGMSGEQCLEYIKKKSDTVVWISPVFKKEWEKRDSSGTIQATKNIIPMHDLTVGGVEDAIKELMEK
ncbi:MAG: hypothetical protein NTZ38_02815 [Candidatus Taylorbacteria bacterium]|nr:hypothetical protein [Candidatus Taylorbacteria bacterium]